MKRKIEKEIEKCAFYSVSVNFSIIDKKSGKLKKYLIYKNNLDENEARKELKKYFEIYEKALDEKRVISFERIFVFRI